MSGVVRSRFVRSATLGAVALWCVLAVACGLTLEEREQLGPRPDVAVASLEQVELGRLLFWDPILSGERDVACASCHHPQHGYADGRARSLGTGARGLGPGRAGDVDPRALRNAPTVLDTAYNGLARQGQPLRPEDAPMMWDARVRSLEAQAEGPLLSALEMRGPHLAEHEVWPELVARLTAIEEYVEAFARAYGSAGIDRERILEAISAFERSLVSRDTSFDRFLAGDDTALDLAARRGLVTFFAAGCASCHSGPMFSDYALHDLGLAPVDPITGQRPRIRTPSLRNVARTAPYMHDGSVATLEGAVELYTGMDPTLDPDLADNAPLGPGSWADVARFLEALSDGSFDDRIPERVPSGLPVGGAIE